MSSPKADARTYQRRLRALGVTPPPPAGKPVHPGAGKAGHYYRLPDAQKKELAAYVAQLRALLDAHEGAWSAKAHAHAVLMAAYAAAGREPEGPLHGGVAARPAFGNPGHLRALFFLLQQVKPAPREAKAHAAAEAIVVGMLNPQLRSKAEQRRLQQVVLHSPASPLARFVTDGAFRSLQASPVDPMTRKAAEEVVRTLDRARVPDFLRALDRVLLREDCAAVLEGRFDGGLVEDVLFRAAADGKTTHWLARLKGGQYVLTWKVKGKFHVVHGEKDTVLASVPDAQMAAALSAVE